MALTKEQREALDAEQFAVPETREIPIHDERHLRMGWSQINCVSGLTDEQRARARRRMIRKASDLRLDTADWAVSTISFSLEAMSLAVPDDPDHPNRMPFKGILTRIDECSDEPPGGSEGKLTFIPRAVAERSLSTLLGMGVDCSKDFDEHNAKFKIGVITEATVSGNAIHIAGFLYAKDFPEECSRIKRERNKLGWSYECQFFVLDKDANPWVAVECVFTGAAILYKEKAAYHSTSLAASAAQEDSMTPEELKKLNDSIAALAASVGAITKDVADLKAGASLGGPIIEQVKPHVEACSAAAAAMRASGIGSHPEHGHAKLLEKLSAHMAAEAAMGRVPSVYRDHNFLEGNADATVKAAVDAAAKVTDERVAAVSASLKTVTDGIASLTTIVKDLQAKAVTASAEPARKTISPDVQALLTKVGLQASTEGDGKFTVAQVDEMLGKSGLTGHQRLAAKLNLNAAGLIG